MTPMNGIRACIVSSLLLSGLLSVGLLAASHSLRPPLWIDHDDADIPEPVEREVSELYAIVYNSWLRHFSFEYQADLVRGPRALNVNAWDEVPDSTWFTNRLTRRSMAFDEIERTLDGHAPAPGRWRIVRILDEGYTPKFEIQDQAGRRYVLKLDLPTALERNSAAERMCTLILHAAGYNLPHNSIVYFRADDLYLDDKSYYRDVIGTRRPLGQTLLAAMIAKLKPLPDGRYRALASFFLPGDLPGKPVGRFVYTGRRKDDPNDIIPHELRRELRGLRVIASWINHVDVGDKNALDVYVTKDGRRFVKHYLLDLGSAMGSGDFLNGPYRVGHEYLFDGAAIGRSFVTLGIWERPWDARGKILYPEVGYYQAEVFEPARWKPNYPNLAFERMDHGDAYWGAKIVSAFSDETIRQLARAGQYSRPEVTQHIEDTLKSRRDAIGRYWLDRITPLEDPRLDEGTDEVRLRFRDLALERGYADAQTRRYRLWVEDLNGQKLLQDAESRGSGGELALLGLRPLVSRRPQEPADRYGRVPALRILIQSSQRDGRWALPIEAIVGTESGAPAWQVLGWTHAATSRHAS